MTNTPIRPPYIAEIIDRSDNNRTIETIVGFITRDEARDYAIKVCNTFYANHKHIVYKIVDRTVPPTESGQAVIILLVAIAVIIICLALCYQAVSQMTGSSSLFATLLDGIASAIK